jgi:hypothetical protein
MAILQSKALDIRHLITGYHIKVALSNAAFQPIKGALRMTQRHAGIITGQGGPYRQGWLDYCCEPPRRYSAGE